jgi:DNA-binding transcriptional MerR regulator
MDKASGAYRTISEVAEELDIPQHVLRFWETRFPQIRPMKRSGGRRYYRPGDVLLLRGIRRLLYGEGYTIKGVQRILSAQGIGAVQQAGGASGEDVALAAELDHDTHQAADMLPEESASAEPQEAFEDQAFEDKVIEAAPAQSPAEAPAPPEEAISASDGFGLDRSSVRPAPQPALSREQRQLLEGALEELRACARHLATLRGAS